MPSLKSGSICVACLSSAVKLSLFCQEFLDVLLNAILRGKIVTDLSHLVLYLKISIFGHFFFNWIFFGHLKKIPLPSNMQQIKKNQENKNKLTFNFHMGNKCCFVRREIITPLFMHVIRLEEQTKKWNVGRVMVGSTFVFNYLYHHSVVSSGENSSNQLKPQTQYNRSSLSLTYVLSQATF